MKIKYLLLVLLFMNPGGISYSQQNVEGNIRIIDRLINDGIHDVRNLLIPLGDEKLYTLMYDRKNPEAEYIARKLQSGLQGFKVLLGVLNENTDYVIELSDELIRVKYPFSQTDNILGTKRIRREVTVKFLGSLKDSRNDSSLNKVNFSKTVNDFFEEDLIRSVEDSPAEFAKGKLPEGSASEKILLPAIMIGVSAVAIILFFTIRSK